MSTATAAQAGTMSLAGHLSEARTRAFRAAVALVLGAVAGFLLADPVMDLLRAPIAEIATVRNASLNYETVTGAFDLRMRLAVYTGIALSAPVWLYQLFAYLTPGLTAREKRYTFGFLAAALPLFAAGCAAGLALVPHMVALLTGFAAADESTILQASTYVDFVMKVALATGVAFVLPALLVVLNLLGLLPARTMLRGWRVAVIAITLFSAMVTPAADVISMFLVAVPMTLLYLSAVLIATWHDRRTSRRTGVDLSPGTSSKTPPKSHQPAHARQEESA